jgi:hexosaminidase
MYRRLDAISIQLEELGLTHETNGDMLLRRVVKSKEIGPLKLLVSLVEPVKEYRRNQGRAATTLTPLTRLIDAARADTEGSRRFAFLVDGLLTDAPLFQRNQDRIRTVLSAWRDVRPALDVLIEKSPILHEAEQLSRDLSDVSTAGLEAISYLAEDVAPPDGWRDAKMAMLDQAAKPKAEVEFAMIGSVRKLIILAASKPGLKSLPQSEWKDRVRSLTAEISR